ncbi:4,5-DOPA dioxygenase extradiol [Flavobacterium sp. F372]|uniref:4,5-DOPA dioxygenase extradiol n=2 Tax=Flavobacterium bernardetii TaxID=2813823 RepID=A0ABR7J2I7_9FLAO|nr:4,5-DOPA dioxygenase extradiol [Flavobacterium bernardetii]NHF71201.1 4,5-DOPA dioxygenase extradiol [Flavobacterium bernardetii]
MNRKQFLGLLSLTPILYAMRTVNELFNYKDILPNTVKMPVLFLGHGSPMNAIEENEFVTGFRNIAKTIPTPTAILCISAHWFTKGTKVTEMKMPQTIHDFGGFPKELFDVQYPAKGSPELAQLTKELILPTEVELNHDWGLDHGGWSVIKHLYPEANIPVIQMSIDYSLTGQAHFDMAQKLQSLRNKGILIIGSGNIVHNLRMVDWANFDKDNYGFDWAIEAREKINKNIIDGDFANLINYQKQGKAFDLAIPTPDHYLPLLYTLGLKNESENIQLFNDKLLAGSLSMTSVKIG